MSTYTDKHKAYYQKNKERILSLRKEREVAWLATPKGKYSVQKRKAKQRKIEWEFTFYTWLDFWGPLFDQRGDEAGKLCMCRKHDIGPYSPENCYIAKFEDNTKEVYLRNGINHLGQFNENPT